MAVRVVIQVRVRMPRGYHPTRPMPWNQGYFRVELLVWALTLCTSAGAAAEPSTETHFERLSVDDGLSHSIVRAIVQDRRGFLWFGTQDGLNRYDGVEFTVYRHDGDHEGTLSDNHVSALLEDREGSLWIGTTHGLNRFDPKLQRFVRFHHDRADPSSIGGDNVSAMYEDRAGALWIGTNRGLDRLDRQGDKFVHYRHDPDDSRSLGPGSVLALTEDRLGNLWVGTTGGLSMMDHDTGRFRRYRHDPADPASLSNDTVSALHADETGMIWIGTGGLHGAAGGGGLSRLDPSSGEMVHYRHSQDDEASLSNDVVTAIHADRSGRLWVGTSGSGLNLFDPASGGFVRYQHDPNEDASLSADVVMAIHQDRAGAIWIGTIRGGVSKIDPTRKAIAHYRRRAGDPASLSNNLVYAFHEDRAGSMWIATWGGLNRLDRQQRSFAHYRHADDDPSSLSSDRVISIYEDNAEVLWIGTYNGGLNRFDRDAGTFTRYRHDPTVPESLGNDYVWSIGEDAADRLWVATWGGLSRLDPETGGFVRYKHDPDNPASLGSDRIQAILRDSRKQLWVGTWAGLAQLDPTTDTFIHFRHDAHDPSTLSDDKVLSLYEDGGGNLWVGTWGGGLNRFDPLTGRFKRYGEKDGLPNGVIYGIVEDRSGMLWVTTSKGLSRFDPAAETFANFDLDDGLQGREFSAGSAFRTRDGELFFGGANGFNAFRPELLKTNRIVPPVVLTGLNLFGQRVAIGGNSPLSKHIGYTNELVLDHDQSVVEIEFAALGYSNAGTHLYTYRLENFDRDWSPPSHRRSATYTNLDPGRYVFHVRGSNNDMVWNREGASVQVVILPPWWQTWWALLLYAATGLTAMAFYVRYHTRALRAQVRAAQQLGSYTLIEKIGEGGMGVVYRAKHAMLRRPTAVKLLPLDKLDDDRLRRFEREVQLTSELNHPNIVSVYDYGRSSSGVFYYAMEYLDGATLQAVIELDGPQPPARVVQILGQAAGALAEAHAVNLIHRDIKPANIMLVAQGIRPDVAKILDFGIVKELKPVGGALLTHADSITGTPMYLSPEILKAPDSVDARSDIYALGAVGYFLLTGKHVFTGETLAEVCAAHLHSDPVPPSERIGEPLPQDLEALILRCLAKDPADRPQSAAALQVALHACKDVGDWTDEEAHAWWERHRAAIIAHRQRESDLGSGLTLLVDHAPRTPAS